MKKTLLALLPLLVSGQLWAQSGAELIKRGEYLARAADCTACHTAPGGPAFGGGYPVSTPFGVIYGTNISADKQYGIGGWSDDEFVAAVRDGVGKDGQQLYPAMPYDAFTKMSRADVLAIKAYLLAQPAVAQATPQTDLAFPFNQRWGMRFWKWFNFTPGELRPDATQSAQWNQGRYLVEALAHCGTCHTPRTLTMGMDQDKAFAGGDLGGWVAYNITPDRNAGIGSWSQQDLVDYLKSGQVPGRASASGPMAEAVEHSLQYLPDADLQAMAVYLRSVPAIADERQTRPRDRWGAPSQDVFALRGSDEHPQTGATLFSGNCATCHGMDGAGKGSGFHAYPSLFNHGSTGAADGKNLVSVILNGVHRDMRQGEILMPSFAEELNDAQIAELSNYVSRQFGNPAAADVSADQVRKLRADANLPAPPAVPQGDTP
ncbi:cytochrome c [Serratia ficaria]|uniref:Gluconate 2-dehydrogenase cytochrome c subunit n=1 Tax=Serratia ficaria TaxID=61651 RepID=A0A240BZS3_SERFI|nr:MULTISPECIES: cytochrome c [Serratia]MEE4485643.1 cytochrome c [Serratia ficaria]REF45069.1 mono/diheme cytochrome c family protein [Serratia ficaria]CAI0727960.1 Gluconate 2-dehydrogenase cytochrome c subunit precursor [Serratia ficaria]CAI0757097.1 Gluconate 2-dehydrogenase cytochrome c subunit precursor [Serratia ficaria]CAI0855069.1 Gluconate 2-dehydrogenase cytochrome c subunit precursor [Serratia ficaria]